MKPSEPLPSATDCPSGKYGYRSETAARESVSAQARKHNGARRNAVYECPRCHSWHATTSRDRGGEAHRRVKRAGRSTNRRREPLPVDVAFARLEEMNRERLNPQAPL